MFALQCIVLCFLVAVATAQLSTGKPCINSVSRQPGICVKESTCRNAKNANACSYIHQQKIVCCDHASRINTTEGPQKKIGDIARHKCREYSEEWANLNSGLDLRDVIGENAVCTLQAHFRRRRVAGGSPAARREFPHMVHLGFNGTDQDGNFTIDWSCGGTLISNRYVLTAGHCLFEKKKGLVNWARLGDLDMSTEGEADEPLTLRISARIPHPDYDPPNNYHDIALLKLAEHVEFSEHIRPACLNVNLMPEVGFMTTATGWGATYSDGEVTSRLMKVNIPVVSFSHCNKTFDRLAGRRTLTRGIDDSLQLCAGESGKDTCQGDGGGPLQMVMDDPYCMYSILGVTSFGVKQCGPINNSSVGVYTRVSNYVGWIEGYVWADDD